MKKKEFRNMHELEEKMMSYYDKMYKYLGSFHFDEMDREDVLQNAFLTAHKALPSLKHPEAMESWMFRIVKHVAINQKNSCRRRLSHIEEVDSIDEEFPSER